MNFNSKLHYKPKKENQEPAKIYKMSEPFKDNVEKVLKHSNTQAEIFIMEVEPQLAVGCHLDNLINTYGEEVVRQCIRLHLGD